MLTCKLPTLSGLELMFILSRIRTLQLDLDPSPNPNPQPTRRLPLGKQQCSEAPFRVPCRFHRGPRVNTSETLNPESKIPKAQTTSPHPEPQTRKSTLEPQPIPEGSKKPNVVTDFRAQHSCYLCSWIPKRPKPLPQNPTPLTLYPKP